VQFVQPAWAKLKPQETRRIHRAGQCQPIGVGERKARRTEEAFSANEHDR
jgi:hypothetical protein